MANRLNINGTLHKSLDCKSVFTLKTSTGSCKSKFNIVSLVTGRMYHELVTVSFNITCKQTLSGKCPSKGITYLAVCNFRDEPVQKQQHPDDDDDDDFDEQERERMKDLKERDEFADRMKNKDKEKTRQIMSKSEKKVLTMPRSLM